MSDLCTVCHLPIEVGEYPCITTPRPHQRGINGAIGDEIPGGMWQENGFHTPQKFYSKRERRLALAAAGLEEHVRHVTIPGTDKSPFTSDWSKGSMDPYTLSAGAVLVSRNGAYGGNDPAPEPLTVKWQVREVGSKTGAGPWRDCEAPK